MVVASLVGNVEWLFTTVVNLYLLSGTVLIAA